MYSQKEYIRNTERDYLVTPVAWVPSVPYWKPWCWFAKPLLVVLTSLKTSALVPDVAAKNCLPPTKSPGSNTEVPAAFLLGHHCHPLCCLQVHRWAGTIHCSCTGTGVTMASLRPHTASYTQGCRAEPSKPGQGSPLPHTLPATLFCWLWVCPSHCWLCPPWDIGSISCSETIIFFQPQSVYNKAKQATKLRFETGLYFCFALPGERWKTQMCLKLSCSPRIEYRIRGSLNWTTVVQWLRLRLSLPWSWFPSLNGKLRSQSHVVWPKYI